MLNYIKETLPPSTRACLGRARKKIQNKTVDQIDKKILAWKMRRHHAKEIERIKHKKRIKVVFLVIKESVWKVDTVFQKMLDDPFFDPVILACPYVQHDHGRMIEDIDRAYQCFSVKGYPVIRAYDEKNDAWLSIEELDPDLVFFTVPHKLTRPEYYEGAYSKYLTCYVPYYCLATSHVGDQRTFNQLFHCAMWKIFMPHQFSMERARLVAANQAVNCEVTGYPSCESLLVNCKGGKRAWKEQKPEKKKFIFSPHHSINEDAESRLSNFLEYAEFMVELMRKYSNETQWSFKPHPLLKSKLYIHPDWGRYKTDKYYSLWESSDNSQLDEGEYGDLFLQSDAIIHDCSSFIVEYLLVEKPCLYLASNDKQIGLINDYGLKALKAYDIAKDKQDIEAFLVSVIHGGRRLKSTHVQFLSEEIEPLYNHESPSNKILRCIKNEISIAGK
ncbi:CDP-glycerol glycerophosphotransferase family protein [Halomonas nitroreducens]|uniref:CDP-glycerol--glycerophosphate glycerophosphotransferase n=1 Tax=Halomonas nitroreducens TaxID=447425 RepID=A0A431V511_9GAMM|nr:CDP-glycerol glycerophosphotransferase family protein [Halomonas nitroreducens]RTR05360.1 hypothetical protein EKG36_07180 [Halomonas nitroreducens]